MREEDTGRQLENFRHRTLAELENRLDAQDMPREEYDRRVSLALEASSPRDLMSLLSDLPGSDSALTAPGPQPCATKHSSRNIRVS